MEQTMNNQTNQPEEVAGNADSLSQQCDKLPISLISKEIFFDKEVNIYGDFENPLFVARDIAEWIDYDPDSTNKMLSYVRNDEKLTGKILRAGQNREVWFVTEGGLYEILMLSRKPISKKFKDAIKDLLHKLRTNKKSISAPISMLTEINGDFMIAVGERMNKLQQSLTLAENIIEDNADIISGKDAAEASDKLFYIRDFVKFTGDSRVPNKLKEHAFREQLIKDGLIYTKYNSNQKEYYPKAIASKWFIAKLSSTTVNTRNGRKTVSGVTLHVTMRGLCHLLVKYGGATQKNAQQIIAEATGSDNRNLAAGSPKSSPPQTSATPARNPLEPTQFVENGVVKPIEAKMGV